MDSRQLKVVETEINLAVRLHVIQLLTRLCIFGLAKGMADLPELVGLFDEASAEAVLGNVRHCRSALHTSLCSFLDTLLHLERECLECLNVLFSRRRLNAYFNLLEIHSSSTAGRVWDNCSQEARLSIGAIRTLCVQEVPRSKRPLIRVPPLPTKRDGAEKAPTNAVQLYGAVTELSSGRPRRKWRRSDGHQSPVGSSLPLTDANRFADALGVAPVYRQKETKRWSSALQLYRQMSNHDIAEHVGRQQHTGTSNDLQEGCVSDDGSSQDHRFVQTNFRCLSPSLRSSSVMSGMPSLDNLLTSKACSASCRDIASPQHRSPSCETNVLNRSTDASENASPGESSLNSLELEAIAAVHELHFAVRDISVSDLLPRTSELIFLNITTLEGQAYCIELTMKGWRVTSLRHDCMNGDLAHLDLHTLYFETVYSLMDTISACYRQRFTDLLALRLRQVQAVSESDNHLSSMPEGLSGSDSSIEASRCPSAPSCPVNEQESEVRNSSGQLMILDDGDYGRPITINVKRNS
uniref:DUF727 domain-containing protein n=1 Tax=Trichuris muris TaxID=70415 RepID=A0A5S6Q7E6_TRIMR